MSKVDILKDWSTLNENLLDLTEDECVALLKREEKGENRFSFVVRIKGRINKLRVRREHAELLKRKGK